MIGWWNTLKGLSLVVFLASYTSATIVETLTTRIPPRGNDCYYQSCKSSWRVKLVFQVIGGGGWGVNFRLRAPDGLLVSLNHQKDGVHSIANTVEGDYEFCFDNSFDIFNENKIFFEFILVKGNEKKEYDAIFEHIYSTTLEESNNNTLRRESISLRTIYSHLFTIMMTINEIFAATSAQDSQMIKLSVIDFLSATVLLMMMLLISILLFEAQRKRSLLSKTIHVDPSAEEYRSLLQYLEHKLEGSGECIYTLGESLQGKSGLSEKELASSRATLRSLTELLGYDCGLIQERHAAYGCMEEYLIRKKLVQDGCLEGVVAIVGSEKAGKHTLLGVLTHCELDTGSGYSRKKLDGNESGIVGFTGSGVVVNKLNTATGQIDRSLVYQESSKVITFICSNDNYDDEKLRNLEETSEFCMLVTDLSNGVPRSIDDMLLKVFSNKLSVFLVVTKTDLCKLDRPTSAMNELQEKLKSEYSKIIFHVHNMDNVIGMAKLFTSNQFIPVLQISNVTGENMGLLKAFLNLLSFKTKERPMRFEDNTLIPSNKSDAIKVWEFKANVLVLHLADLTPIAWNHQGFVHCRGRHQAAVVRNMSRQILLSGEEATVQFQFLNNPEYLAIGLKFVFRSSGTTALGTITELGGEASVFGNEIVTSKM